MESMERQPFAHESFTNILRQIVLNAEKNHDKCPTHRRHPSIVKKLTVLFILAGPMAYELIQQNIPEALPSIRTVQSAIYLIYTKVQGTLTSTMHHHLFQ